MGLNEDNCKKEVMEKKNVKNVCVHFQLVSFTFFVPFCCYNLVVVVEMLPLV